MATPLSTNIVTGQAGHAALHNQERQAVDDLQAAVDAKAPLSPLWVGGAVVKAGQLVLNAGILYSVNADGTLPNAFTTTGLTLVGTVGPAGPAGPAGSAGAAGPTGPTGPSGDASVALADIDGLIDEPVVANVPIAKGRNVVTAIASAFAWVDLTLPATANTVPFTIRLSDGTTTGGTATVAIGGYRAIFPSAVTYPAGSVVFCVPTASGGGGASLRHKTGTAQTIPAAPNAPTGVAVAAPSTIATVSWTAPTAGATPMCYTIYRQPASGAAAGPILGNVFGTTVQVAGHSAGDAYAVESVVLGRGSGPTAYVTVTGGVAGMSFTTKTSGALADGAIPTTGTGDFIALAPMTGSTAVYTGGSRVLTSGTAANANQLVKVNGLSPVSAAGGLVLKDIVKFGDSAASSWLQLIDSATTDPSVTFTRGIRLTLNSASLTIGAKAPSTVFAAGTAGAFTTIPKADATTSSTIPAIGSTGATIILEFTPPDGTGAMTVNVYTATIANFSTAYPGNQTTLVHTVALTPAQVTALFGSTGTPITQNIWEVSATGSVTAHTITFGPTVASHLGA